MEGIKLRINKLTKYAVIILAVILLCQSMFVSAAEVLKENNEVTDVTEKIIYSQEYKTLYGLGMLTDEYVGLPMNANLTRAQYAYVIARLYGYNDGDKYENKFIDIKDENYYTGAVNYLRERKIINGINAYQFAPNDPINVIDAAVISVRALGYEEMAKNTIEGDDALKIKASQLGLLNGISNINGVLTVEDGYKLLYTTATTPVMNPQTFSYENIDYSIKNGEDMLNIFCKIKHANGVLSDNGITALNGDTGAGYGKIIVGGMRFFADNCYNDVKELIGRNVKFFYNENEEKLIYAYADERKNDVVELSAEDLATGDSSFSTTNVPYYDKKDNVRNIKVSIYADMIYNGSSYNFGADDLKIRSGKMLFISNDGDNVYDVIIVRSYMDYVVNTVTEDSIYTEDETINLTDYEIVNVYNDNGSKLNLSSIGKDSLITVFRSRNKKIIDIYANRTVVNGEVTAINVTEKQRNCYTISDIIYTASPNLEAKMALTGEKKIELAKTYKFYINKYGEIAAFEENFYTGNLKIAYCVGISQNKKNIFDTEAMALLVMEGGMVFKAYFKDKFTLNDTTGVRPEYILPGGAFNNLFESNGKPVRQPVRVCFNDDGDIIEMQTAVVDKRGEDYPFDLDNFSLDAEIENAEYKGKTQRSVGIYSFSSNAMVVIDPYISDSIGFETENVDIFNIAKMPEGTCGKSYVYDMNQSLVGEILVCQGGSSTFSEQLIIVDNVYSVWNSEKGEARKAINGYSDSKEVSYRESKLGVIPEDVSRGDVYKFQIDSNGELVSMQRIIALKNNPEPFISDDSVLNSKWCNMYGYMYSASNESVVMLKPDTYEETGVGKLIGNSITSVKPVIYDREKDKMYLGTIAELTTYTPNPDGTLTINSKTPRVYIYRRYDYIREMVFIKN